MKYLNLKSYTFCQLKNQCIACEVIPFNYAKFLAQSKEF